MRRPVVILLVAGAAAVLVIAGVAVVLLLALPGRGDGRFATPERPMASPSGRYTAEVTLGPEENGVKTWMVRIRESQSGQLVFTDDYAYSTRHPLRITWLSTADQLWLVSGDVGTSHVDPQPDGTWTKKAVTPDDRAAVPEEIRQLS
jgi:hypothetical protein